MDTTNTIRVIVADDHLMFLDGLISVLKEEEDIEIVSIATDGRQVLDYLRCHRDGVDVAVLDIEMPHLNGVETTCKLQEHYPDVKILVLTSYNQEGFITRILQAGASGYILKNNGRDVLVEAIRTVSQGQRYLGKEATKTLVESHLNPRAPKAKLTRRETEVLTLVGDGLNGPQIAQELKIKESTVITHRNNLIDKLGVEGTRGLVRYAVAKGYTKKFP